MESLPWIVLGALLVAAPASAQTPPTESDRDAEARGEFRDGQSAYAEGDYRQALGHFNRAHELSGRPEMLYNIGQASDRLGLRRDAVVAFEAFLEAVPDSPQRGQVEARLSVLRRDIEVEESLRAASSRDQGADDVDDDDGGSVWASPWLWIVVGAVVAGGIVTAVVLTSGGEEPQPGDVGGVIEVLRLGR